MPGAVGEDPSQAKRQRGLGSQASSLGTWTPPQNLSPGPYHSALCEVHTLGFSENPGYGGERQQ